MKHLKHLLFLSTLCSLVLFSSCEFIFEKSISAIAPEERPENCGCGHGIVLDAGYISEIEAAGDSVSCYAIENWLNDDVYMTLENTCSGNIKTFCGKDEDGFTDVFNVKNGTEWCISANDYNGW